MMFTDAIILSRSAFQESDERISLLTEQAGKLTVIAKGSKKSTSKTAAHLEPSTIISLGIAPGKQQGYAISVQSLIPFPVYRQDQLLAVSTGMQLVEALLVEADTHDIAFYGQLRAWIESVTELQAGMAVWWLDVLIVVLFRHMGYALAEDSGFDLLSHYSKGAIGEDMADSDRQEVHNYLHTQVQYLTEKAILDWGKIDTWLH